MRHVIILASCLLGAGSSGCGGDPKAPHAEPDAGADAGPPLTMVSAHAELASTLGDPDDSAIWIHPADPAQSRILTTDKERGLFVFDLEGTQLQAFPDFQLNNVDLRYGFSLRGRSVALAVATDRKDDTLAVFAIDEESGEVSVAPGSGISVGEGSPFPVYGGCMYRSPAGESYAFVNTKGGAFKQFELRIEANRVVGEVVRIFGVDSQPEGCAVDDGSGVLFVGEERRGLHKLDANPDGSSEPTLVDGVEAGRLTPDVEGVAIYHTGDGTGYVLVSSQGDDSFAVYRLEGDNEYLGSFGIGAGEVDEVTHTDGIDVSHMALSPRFPSGVFVAHDDRDDSNGKPGFKLVSWEEIAMAFTPPLAIDTSAPVRP